MTKYPYAEILLPGKRAGNENLCGRAFFPFYAQRLTEKARWGDWRLEKSPMGLSFYA